MTAIMNEPPLLLRRKKLRTNQTNAERKLWSRLRAKRFFGLKFSRQQSVGPYVLDFYCPSQKLAIEIDGGQHIENVKYDALRSEYLFSIGIQVIRYWNSDVLKDTDAALEQLMITIFHRPPLSTSSPHSAHASSGEEDIAHQ